MFNKLYRPNGFHDLIVHKNLKFKISKKKRHAYICPFECDVMFPFNRLNKYLIPLDIQLWCLLSPLLRCPRPIPMIFSVVFEHKINIQQNSVQICGLQMQQQLFDIINFQHLLTQMSAYSLAALTCASAIAAGWLAGWLPDYCRHTTTQMRKMVNKAECTHNRMQKSCYSHKQKYTPIDSKLKRWEKAEAFDCFYMHFLLLLFERQRSKRRNKKLKNHSMLDATFGD